MNNIKFNILLISCFIVLSIILLLVIKYKDNNVEEYIGYFTGELNGYKYELYIKEDNSFMLRYNHAMSVTFVGTYEKKFKTLNLQANKLYNENECFESSNNTFIFKVKGDSLISSDVTNGELSLTRNDITTNIFDFLSGKRACSNYFNIE